MTRDQLPTLTAAEVEALTGLTPSAIFRALDGLDPEVEVARLDPPEGDPPCEFCGGEAGEGAYCEACGANLGP